MMRRRGFSESAIVAALLVENRDRCRPPLGDSEVRKVARSVSRYEPVDDAVASLDELTGLLGLDAIGKRIDSVSVYGRGTKAYVRLLLDDGGQVVLDPLGAACASSSKLRLELASQAGATPLLKGLDVARAVQLIYRLGEHHESGEVADRAWELGAEYLRTAAIGEFVMGEQASRYDAFAALDRAEQGGRGTRQEVVLLDTKTGVRYVRTQWFTDYLRVRTGPGEPAAMMASLERLGWSKTGTEGRIKATRPGFASTLQWAFLQVPKGWEDEDAPGNG